MKIIEALKKQKDLAKKAEDIRNKIALYCADVDCESPTYPDQRRQISEWIQAHHDIVKEIENLKYRVQKTNIETMVTIEIDGKHIIKSIYSWIQRRRELANTEKNAWLSLTNKNIKESYSAKMTANSPDIVVKRRLYYDPQERDKMVEIYRSEPSLIDGILEVINATTELL